MYFLRQGKELNNEEKINYLLSIMYLQNTAILPNIGIGMLFYTLRVPCIYIPSTNDRVHESHFYTFSSHFIKCADNHNYHIDFSNYDLYFKAVEMFYAQLTEEEFKQEKDDILNILNISTFIKNITDEDNLKLFPSYIVTKKKIEYFKDKDFDDYLDEIKKYFLKIETYMKILLNIIEKTNKRLDK